MPEMIHSQSNFTLGEIDERLHARVDLDILTKGAKRARDVLVLPQGGLRRRFGTEYIVTLVIADAASECRIAMFEFEDETRYLLLFEHLSLKIYHDDVLVSTETSPYTAAQLPNIKFTQGSNNFITIHKDVAPYVLERTTAHTGWTYAAIAFSWMPTTDFDRNYDAANFNIDDVTGDITITVTLAVILKASHAGGLYTGAEGTARINTVNVGAQTCAATVLDDFKTGTTDISGKLSVLTEPVWSAALGYPRCATFFQNRLCLGGSSSLPQGVWMSKTSDFADFDDSEVLASSSIGFFIHTNNSNVVEDILAEKAFLIFTSTGLVSTQMLADSPLTPTNAAFNLQNNDGIGSVRPLIYDNKVVYMDRGGKVLWGTSYDVQKGGHIAADISLLSQGLIDQPVEMAIYRNPDIDNGNYLILINNDGTLPILQSVDNQDVLGWTKSSTDHACDGYFRHIASSENIVYFIIERVINSVTKFYIEKMNFEIEMDSTSIQDLGASLTTVTGLTYLTGELVRVIGDGKLQKSQTVVGDGITLDRAATDVEIGLDYFPSIIPLPINIATQVGNDLYLAKRIKTFWVDYYESLGIYVDDELIPYLILDESLFDTAPDPRTNFSLVTPMHGWEPRAEIEITQKDPYPMVIRGVGQEVEVT